MASYLYRAAQPLILAAFLPWGGSAGAGRIRLAGAKVFIFSGNEKFNRKRVALRFPVIVLFLQLFLHHGGENKWCSIPPAS